MRMVDVLLGLQTRDLLQERATHNALIDRILGGEEPGLASQERSGKAGFGCTNEGACRTERIPLTEDLEMASGGLFRGPPPAIPSPRSWRLTILVLSVVLIPPETNDRGLHYF